MLNSICIVGRFVADPELRMTSTNTPITTFTVAVDRDFVKAGEERQTDFLDVVAWRQTAEFVTKFFRKGYLIAVQGSLQVRNYEDKNGNKRKAYEIVAANVSFCGAKQSNTADRFEDAAAAAKPASFSNAEPGEFEEIEPDDDLPF